MINVLKNWNLRRILYLLGGAFIIITAVKDQTWWIAIFGIYFVAMSIFRFGCAAGNCELPLTKKEENL